MQQSWADKIWSIMQIGKYYSIGDLANLTDQPDTLIINSVTFLSKYGFVRGFGQPREIFTKTGKLSPAMSAHLLVSMVDPSPQLDGSPIALLSHNRFRIKLKNLDSTGRQNEKP